MTGERNDKLKKVMFLWVLLEDKTLYSWTVDNEILNFEELELDCMEKKLFPQHSSPAYIFCQVMSNMF